MFKVQISGKPSNFRAMPDQAEESKYGASFDLVERHWTGTEAVSVRHRCYVPNHRVKYAQGRCEKGFTIMIEASTVFSGEAPHEPTEQGGFNLGLTDIIDL